MTQVTDNARLEGAFYQAKAALRAGRKGDQYEFARIANRMWDTIDQFDYPYFTSSRLIRRLGRGRSMVLGLSRPLINLALKMDIPN